MNVIELKGIGKTFIDRDEPTVALKNVNLNIETGEFVAIIGPSGSGKSTLMNVLGLLDAPSEGDYLLDGQLVSSYKDRQLAKLRREKIGFVFQSFNLLPRLSVVGNVELPLTYAGVRGKARRRRALELLRLVGLEDRAGYRPNQISGGQTQRVAIARALANRPSLILADEPTGNLDTKSSTAIIDELRRLNRETGATIVIVTHNPEIAELTDRTITVRDGEILSDQSNHHHAPAHAHLAEQPPASTPHHHIPHNRLATAAAAEAGVQPAAPGDTFTPDAESASKPRKTAPAKATKASKPHSSSHVLNLREKGPKS
jgi:putative ABC transport system ATP-binding protein